jgi:hypothetical protein
VGSGKTTVAVEIGEVLDDWDLPHVICDLDWLAWVRPAAGSGATVGTVLLANLALVWGTFRDAGVERLVLARARADVDALRGALPGVELSAVRLAAPREELERRIRRRDTGAQLAEHLAATASPPARAPGEVVIETAGRSPREVAEAVLVAAGWSRL